MKKLFYAIIAISLSAIFMLSAGCMGATPLSFNNAYNNKNESPVGYTETVTYSVTNKDYNALTKDSSVTDDVLKYSFNGTATTTLKILGSISDFNVATDLDLSGTGRDKYYYFKSELVLKANYKTKGTYAGTPTDNSDGSKTYDDVVINEALFFASGQSFSPIWSKTKANYSYLNASGNELVVNVNTLEREEQTTYNTNSYTIEKKHKANGSEQFTSTSTHSYTQKTVIDSNSLLFALRNIEVKENSNYSLPTISATYGTQKTLSVKNNGEKQLSLNLNYNGANLDSENVPVKDYTFVINSDKNSGTLKYVSIQKNESANLPSKSLLVEYAEPLSIYGTFSLLGALVYTIDSVTISQ